MFLPRVFIAYASEGLDVVDAVQTLLNAALHGVAEVKPWPATFQLSRAYIESLDAVI